MRISVDVKEAVHTARSVDSIERDDGSSGMSGLQVNGTGWPADGCLRAFLLCPVGTGWTRIHAAFVVRTNARTSPADNSRLQRRAGAFRPGGG